MRRIHSMYEGNVPGKPSIQSLHLLGIGLVSNESSPIVSNELFIVLFYVNFIPGSARALGNPECR